MLMRWKIAGLAALAFGGLAAAPASAAPAGPGLAGLLAPDAPVTQVAQGCGPASPAALGPLPADVRPPLFSAPPRVYGRRCSSGRRPTGRGGSAGSDRPRVTGRGSLRDPRLPHPGESAGTPPGPCRPAAARARDGRRAPPPGPPPGRRGQAAVPAQDLGDAAMAEEPAGCTPHLVADPVRHQEEGFGIAQAAGRPARRAPPGRCAGSPARGAALDPGDLAVRQHRQGEARTGEVQGAARPVDDADPAIEPVIGPVRDPPPAAAAPAPRRRGARISSGRRKP